MRDGVNLVSGTLDVSAGNPLVVDDRVVMEAFATASSFSVGFVGAGAVLEPTAITGGIIEAFIGAPEETDKGGSAGSRVTVTGGVNSTNVTARGDIDAHATVDGITLGGLFAYNSFGPFADAGGKTRAFAGNGADLRLTDLNISADGDAKSQADLLSAAVSGIVSLSKLSPTATTTNDVEAYVGRNADSSETDLATIVIMNQVGAARADVDVDAKGSSLAVAKTLNFGAAGIADVSLTTAIAEMAGKTRAYVGQYTNLTAGNVTLTATEVAAQAQAFTEAQPQFLVGRGCPADQVVEDRGPEEDQEHPVRRQADRGDVAHLHRLELAAFAGERDGFDQQVGPHQEHRRRLIIDDLLRLIIDCLACGRVTRGLPLLDQLVNALIVVRGEVAATKGCVRDKAMPLSLEVTNGIKSRVAPIIQVRLPVSG